MNVTTGDLADLIKGTKGDRSYADLARESGGAVMRQRWHQLATTPLKTFPDPPTIEAIARGLGVPVTGVVIACARSVGLNVHDPAAFAGIDVSGVPEDQAEAVRRLVATLRGRGPEGPEDPEEPGVDDAVDELRRRAREVTPERPTTPARPELRPIEGKPGPQ